MQCVCIRCSVHVGYAVLSTNNAMYMLGMQCYVQVVLRACCTCGAMYICCGVHDCMSGVMCMWCCVHVVSHTCHACGTVYMWYCVHVVQVAWCTCGVVNMLCRWRCVHVMMCTRCVGGEVYHWYYVHVVHMVLVHMWYCVHVIHVVLRACGIMYVHHVVMVLWHVYSLCGTLCRYMNWVVFHIGYRWMDCIVNNGCRCMCCMLGVDGCISWCGMPCNCMCVMHIMCLFTWLRIRHWVFVGCRN